MALTSEFTTAVKSNNLLRVRIMLKDSLLVDKHFAQFKKMRDYAEHHGVDFWMEKSDELDKQPKEMWNPDLMNLELTKLVNDFTKERLEYCQAIIEKIYGINSEVNHNYSSQSQVYSKPAYQVQTSSPRASTTVLGSNHDDYDMILEGVAKMNRILRENKSEDGRTWRYDDIETIQEAAKRVSKACENIKVRRGQSCH